MDLIKSIDLALEHQQHQVEIAREKAKEAEKRLRLEQKHYLALVDLEEAEVAKVSNRAKQQKTVTTLDVPHLLLQDAAGSKNKCTQSNKFACRQKVTCKANRNGTAFFCDQHKPSDAEVVSAEDAQTSHCSLSNYSFCPEIAKWQLGTGFLCDKHKPLDANADKYVQLP